MLVANAGHTPYSFLSNQNNANNKINATPASSSSSASSSTRRLNSNLSHNLMNSSKLFPSTSTIAVPSSSGIISRPSKYDVFNSISVKINKSAELIKQTVNKALLSKFTSSLNNKCKLKIPIVRPTSTHRSPNRDSKSTDSINLEMCFFKPIKTWPTTSSNTDSGAIIIKKPRPEINESIIKFQFRPVKSSLCLYNSSRNSAFYLYRRPNENDNSTETTNINIEKDSIKSYDRITRRKNRNLLNNKNETNMIVINQENHITSSSTKRKSLKRSRSKSKSIERKKSIKKEEKICRKRKKIDSDKAFVTENNNNNDNNNFNGILNGLFEEFGRRRSVRLFNKNQRSISNCTNDSNFKKQSINQTNKCKESIKKINKQNMIEKRTLRMTRSSKIENLQNHEINDWLISNVKMMTKNDKITKNNKKTKNNIRKNKRLTSAKLSKEIKQQKSMQNNECIRNLRPRNQRTLSYSF